MAETTALTNCSHSVNNRLGAYTLDGSRLPKGLYILDISSGEFHKRIKVQKDK